MDPEISFSFPSCQINLLFIRVLEEGLQSDVGCLPIVQFPIHSGITHKSFPAAKVPIFSTRYLTQWDRQQPKLYLRQCKGSGALPRHFSAVVFWMSNQFPLIGVSGALKIEKGPDVCFEQTAFLLH